MYLEKMHSSQLGLVFSVAVSTFFGLISHSTVCSERHACLAKETCYGIESGWFGGFSCSFKTTITPTGYRLLNTSMKENVMQLANRGICAPGLRQQVDSVQGSLTCVRKRSWPSAFMEEIGDPEANTDHGRYCGRWISAGSVAYGNKKWAFFDAAATERDVDNVVRATGASRMAITDLGKFRSSCRTMVASNSAGASVQQAYKLLHRGANHETLISLIEEIGFLASHYCYAPALVGVGRDNGRFVSRVLPGAVISSQSIRDALYAVGEDRHVRNEASEFAAAMQQLHPSSLQEVTQAQVQSLVLGSHQGTWIDGYVGPTFSIGNSQRNEPLERFVCAFGLHGATKAAEYIKGVAAVCAHSARSIVAQEVGNIVPWGGEGSPSHAAALGRLSVHGEEDVDSLNENDLNNASTVRLSALHSVSSASPHNARETCLAAAKRVFPDDFDRITFTALVTPTLYERLERLVDLVREAAAVTMSEDLMGSVFKDRAVRTEAVSKIRGTKVRIAGAPRGTWAGVEREFRRPVITSEDSALTIIVKQARAVYLDRLLTVVSDAKICEHASIYPGVSRNAYLLLSSTSSCSMILPGLIVPPFADERYDDVSLATRLGFVIAHEFMHVTAFSQFWDEEYVHSFLSSYPTSTHVEAMADVGAAATIMRLSNITNDTLCASASQLFCGRVGWMPVHNSVPPWHPPTNMRGDNICNFIRMYF